jgi:hypothetical protein
VNGGSTIRRATKLRAASDQPKKTPTRHHRTTVLMTPLRFGGAPRMYVFGVNPTRINVLATGFID